MASRKRKIVFTAEEDQARQIADLVDRGAYRSASELLREAIDEKLERIRRAQLREQVARYSVGGHGGEDAELIDWQDFDESP